MELTEQQKLEILCAYLPHRVEVKRPSGNMFILGTYSNMRGSGREQRSIETAITDNYRPLLRHPDDMTEDENEHKMKLWTETSGMLNTAIIVLRYLHSIHVDTFGAIEAGWAVRKEVKNG